MIQIKKIEWAGNTSYDVILDQGRVLGEFDSKENAD